MDYVLAISGVSGAGKSSVFELMDGTTVFCGNEQKQIDVLPSDCTRKQRSKGERWRNTITKGEFLKKKQEGKYIQAIHYGLNEYGILKSCVEQSFAKNHLVAVDVIQEGVLQIRNNLPDACIVAIFLFVDAEDLYQRLLKRGSSAEEIRTRLMSAKKEMCDAVNSSVYQLFIQNDNLAQTKARILDFLADGVVDTIDVVDVRKFCQDVDRILSTLNCEEGE